jgi:hypothetical protein
MSTMRSLGLIVSDKINCANIYRVDCLTTAQLSSKST